MSSNQKYQLSNPQQRIWLTELLNNRLDMANIGYSIQLKGKYDLQRLAQAVLHVVNANTALKLAFDYAGEDKQDLLQFYPTSAQTDITIIEAADEDELLGKLDAIHRNRFHVTDGSLCSFAVYSIAGERFGFFEKAHHLVADGISATIVAREVIDTYKKLENNEFKAETKEYDYTHFLDSEKQYIEGPKYRKDKEYWRGRFENYSGEDIAFKLDMDRQNSLKVNRRNFNIPAHLQTKLAEFNAQHRLSNFALFMAAMGIYFKRFFNHRDLVIGMPVHNRTGKIFRDMVGMFVSTLPFRLDFEEGWSFNQLVGYIKKELWNALKHQSYPYNHLVKDLKEMNIDSSGFLNVQLIELPGGNEEEIEERAFYSTQYNISQLSVYLNQQNTKELQELEVAVDYHVDIFQEKEVDALFHRLLVILDQAISQPDKDIDELSLLEESEYDRLVNQLNDTAADYPEDSNIPEQFAKQVAQKPDAPALEYEGAVVSYAELAALTDKLALRLRDSGIGQGDIVGILCERSLEAVICILAVLKAGGAYLPIDPAYPRERKSYIVENSGIKVLLIEKVLENEDLQLPGTVTTMVADYAALKAEEPAGPFEPVPIPAHGVAYVIYTSGTTGKPKGTLVTHKNALNYICWGAKYYVGDRPMTFPLFSSLSFDLTVTSIFIPLLTGNKIVVYRDNPEGLLIEKVFMDNKVDIIKLTPSHLKIVKEMKNENPSVKSFIVGGEELKTDTAADIDHYFKGNINIFNEYGPTEATVGCMIHRYDRDNDGDRAVPIGKPSDNVAIYILDGEKRLLPKGIVGEIYIGGKGVAKGYHKRPELTAERFVDNPFRPGEKMYKSGDLGRWNLDETLEFFGRCDEQVKIRGYRIEPGEVEQQLLQLDMIKDAVVMVVQDKAGQKALCAYMVRARDAADDEGTKLDTRQVRSRLGENLPDYMVPAFFVEVEKIPLTNNGKVDRRALPEPQYTTTSGEGLMPATELEKRVRKTWGDVLGMENLGLEDNFFELGGDSIKAVQISARLNDMDLSVNAKDILEYQTINQLILNVDFYKERKVYEQGIVRGTKNPTAIESWFFDTGFVNPGHYNLSVLLEFARAVNPEALKKALTLMVEHHDGLRLNADMNTRSFIFNGKHLEQPVELEVHTVAAGESVAERVREIGDRVKASFDIGQSLLLKPVLIQCAASGKEYLLLTLHHLIVDGVTWRILLEDLYNLYKAFDGGGEAKLPSKTASLTDWRRYLEEYSRAETLQEEIPYWNEIVDYAFTVAADTGGAVVPGTIKERVKLGFRTSEEETEVLVAGSRKSFNSDVEVLLITALAVALKESTGKDGVVVELENNGRIFDDIDLSRTAGWFTAMYPKLLTLDKEDLTGRIKSVKEQLNKTPNSGVGYGILKYIAGKISGEYRSQVRFNYLGRFDQEVSNDLFSYNGMDTGNDISPGNHLTTLVEINSMIIGGALNVELLYDSKVLGETEMTALCNGFERVLGEMAEYLKEEDEVHFTSSDFDTVDLDEDDLEALFG